MKKLRLPARRIALLLVVALLNQIITPTIALALTSGPTQPEVSSFTPAGTSDMVDLCSGDFQYNIPLLDVGGYPINISYTAGAGMDEEASWVGLGWNLNPGVINRQMRGVPDDFRGDTINKSFSMRPDITTGITVGGGLELKGLPLKISASLGMYYNTYKGYGLVAGLSPTLTLAKFGKTKLSAGLGLHFDSQNGLDISPSLGLSQQGEKISNSLTASVGMNSRRGLRDLSISYNVKQHTDGENFRGDDKGVESSYDVGGNVSFCASTYTPTSELPLVNKSFTFHGSVGFEAVALNPNAFIDGYRSEQKLVQNRQKQAAYGYLNSQLAKPSDVMDFNRERQGLPWREYMPVLAPAFGTNDLFAASGQGASGQFRAIRSDIGYYRDAAHGNESESKSFGVELGFSPNLVKVGVDINVTDVNAYSTGWTENNPLVKTAGFTDWDGKSVYEPVFFKNSGEMTVTDETFYAKIGRTSAAQADMEKNSGAIRTAFQFSSNQKPSTRNTFNSSPTIQRAERERRNDVWQYMTAAEAARHGLEKNIYSYKRGLGQIRMSKDAVNCAIDSVLSRTKYKKHHISEVTVLKPDGSRYVYGLPAYNTYQKDVSFSVDETITDNGTGLVQYDTIQKDNSIYNKRGRDQYYSAEVIPPYPYAFMLTGVLSPDYIDRTGNGITSDDYGTAVRINYSKSKKLFNWRTPYGKDSTTVQRVARYQPGRKSDKKAKKASYIYGTKELWYVHSIESTTMVAQFYTSRRFDGLGAITENGNMSTDTSLQKLDRIELYSKSDLQKYGSAATPIKTVNFQYNYELCPGVPNSNKTGGKGKLTLKNIWFTYGKSGRGKLNAYAFNYNKAPASAPTSRFFYNMNNVDRWGNYKVSPPGYPANSEYPYAIQDTTVNATGGVNASIYDFAGAWSLSQITLPSGGTITVDYEPDDYAYVQNKRAGQMYFVKGFSRASSPTTIDSSLYIGTNPVDADMSRYVWVDLSLLKLPANTLPDTNTFKARCLEDIGTIYFNMDVKMTGAVRENITGYMDYDKGRPLQTHTAVSGNYPEVGIPVKIVTTDNNKPIHPITKAALQTMRLELPDLAYPGSQASSAFESVIKGMVGIAQSIKDIFRGFESNKMSKGDARDVGVTNTGGLKSSWIRLCNPRFKKFGGGSRVKQITLNDNWNNMASGQAAAAYGQQYTYTTTQKVKIGATETTMTISSGVASWEPTVGSEENLWKEPVTFNDKIKLAPDNSYYVEKPFGESLFPAPMVAYSEVKVQSIGKQAANKRTGNGWTINKYYTARDFPTIVDYSAPIRYKDASNKLQKFFKIQVKDYLSLTQGFVVEVNDMHGKLKQEASYAQNGALISSTTYEYKVDNPNATTFHLDNKVKVAARDGSIGAEKTLGVDVEMWQDFREESTLTEGKGFAANTDGFWGFIIPILLFTKKAVLNKEDVRFRSAVTTKYIKRSGILAKVTKMQDGSTISTENLLWDSETGAVLATKTQNEFEDPIYQFTYPAHWVYDGMGMAYKNAGAHLTGVYFLNGRPYLGAGATNPLPNFDQMFTDGDEFGGRKNPNRWNFTNDTVRLTTYKVGSDSLRFHTKNGQIFNSTTRKYDLFVIRSGRRNMAGTPVGSITAKTNPLNYASIQLFTADATNNKIVDASAMTFRDLWQRDCNCQTVSLKDTLNPYSSGMKGSWRLENNYANHRERTASKLLTSVGSTNIRTDGTNKSFVPFWDYVSSIWSPNSTGNLGWVRQSTATMYDFKGNQNEETDALGIASMAQYGYQGTLNTAVAHNSRFRQSMAEGFEDYTFDLMPYCDTISSCSFSDHGKFDVLMTETGTAVPSNTVAHSGKYSYKLGNYSNFGLVVKLDTSAGTTIIQPTAGGKHYVYGANACRPSFKPTVGTYLVSGWVYTGGVCSTPQAGPNISIYQQSGTPNFQTFYPSGPVIDGWQRIYGQVQVTTSTGNFNIRLNNTLNQPVYFDDVRFHPWLGNLKSFVYDPISLRLMAILDENNYATFYEYDDEGMLIRVKRETERGVMTIEEHRSALKY